MKKPLIRRKGSFRGRQALVTITSSAAFIGVVGCGPDSSGSSSPGYGSEEVPTNPAYPVGERTSNPMYPTDPKPHESSCEKHSHDTSKPCETKETKTPETNVNIEVVTNPPGYWGGKNVTSICDSLEDYDEGDWNKAEDFEFAIYKNCLLGLDPFDGIRLEKIDESKETTDEVNEAEPIDIPDSTDSYPEDYLKGVPEEAPEDSMKEQEDSQ